jgi:hypothetical protein
MPLLVPFNFTRSRETIDVLVRIEEGSLKEENCDITVVNGDEERKGEDDIRTH